MHFDCDLRVTDTAGLTEAGPAHWALDQIRTALVAHRRKAGVEIRIADGAEEAPLSLPEAAEGYALWRDGDVITAWGHDMRGLVYALTELSDRVVHATGDDPFAGPMPLAEKPTARIRSMARLFCSEEEDLDWFHDRKHWRDYLSMLASCRFNRFSLTLGMGYNYPYHNPWIRDVYFYFPYPFLMDVDGYDVAVRELEPAERDRNLETLKYIGQEAARRGLDFQLALWTQAYDFDDVPNANYTIDGIGAENLAPYCRDALTRLLREVPEITGMTFRVHVEGGIAEGDYGFWEQAFAGIAAAGRQVEIDMHGKGLDATTIDLARKSGMPIAASPKYLAEHMGLAYHQSSIRENEYPPEAPRSEREQLSEGSRKFLRYSYGDLLAKNKDYAVIYRIWAGTQRVLLWGDPALAAGYGRLSMFAGSDGVEWCEPLSFKGRMGLGVPGQRFNYKKQGLAPRRDWQKYLYQYRVWGRGLYNPDGPREGWMRYLDARCGDAAEACERGLAHASRVLPLVTLTHGPSASNNHYWPEIYSNLGLVDERSGLAYVKDIGAPLRFGCAPTFDSQLFANANEYVTAALEGRKEHRYTPFDVADWLDGLAIECEAELARARETRSWTKPEVQRIMIDVAICGGIARFFAERQRAAVWAELFVVTKATQLITRILDHAQRSTQAWDRIADVSREVYHDDLTYGPQSWLRGSWHSRQPEMRAELDHLQAQRSLGQTESRALSAEGERAVAALLARRPVLQANGVVAPESFVRGAPVTVRYDGAADAPPMLRFRTVDQSKRWQSLEMSALGNGFEATVPGEETDTDFHLQFFVSLSRDGVPALVPGLDHDLSNQPYFVALQE